METRLALLASGNGTNAQAIVEAVREGKLDARVCVILTNKENAGVIGRAHSLGVPIEIVPSRGIRDREEYDRTVIGVLESYGVNTIALAGWMRIISNLFIDAFRGRILNLHPAILPSFPGGSGIADACAYGAKLTGCTVHFVTPVLDGGPIIIQAAVPVDGSQEQVEEKIHRMEHLIYPQALQWLAQGRLSIEGRTTVLSPAAKPVRRERNVNGGLVWPPLEV